MTSQNFKQCQCPLESNNHKIVMKTKTAIYTVLYVQHVLSNKYVTTTKYIKRKKNEYKLKLRKTNTKF